MHNKLNSRCGQYLAFKRSCNFFFASLILGLLFADCKSEKKDAQIVSEESSAVSSNSPMLPKDSMPALTNKDYMKENGKYAYLLMCIKGNQHVVQQGSAIIIRFKNRFFLVSNLHILFNYSPIEQHGQFRDYDTVQLMYLDNKAMVQLYDYNNVHFKSELLKKRPRIADLGFPEITGKISTNNIKYIDFEDLPDSIKMPFNTQLFSFGYPLLKDLKGRVDFSRLSTMSPTEVLLNYYASPDIATIKATGCIIKGMSGGPVFAYQDRKFVLQGINCFTDSLDNKSGLISASYIKKSLRSYITSSQSH